MIDPIAPPQRLEQLLSACQMSSEYGPGFHTRPGTAVDLGAYDAYLGRWSRLFVTSVLRAAHVSVGYRILDVATGPGEAALLALPATAPHGRVVGVDIAEPMLVAARHRVDNSAFCCVVADAQALPFGNSCFDAVVCQLSLMFLPDPGIYEKHLKELLLGAGFSDVVVERQQRQDTLESFAAYWQTVENGVGMLPQAYRALPPDNQREVRNEVHAELAKYVSNGHLELGLETLIGAGRA